MTAQEQAQITAFRDRLRDTARRTAALEERVRDVLSCPSSPPEDSIDVEDPDFEEAHRS